MAKKVTRRRAKAPAAVRYDWIFSASLSAVAVTFALIGASAGYRIGHKNGVLVERPRAVVECKDGILSVRGFEVHDIPAERFLAAIRNICEVHA